MLIADPKVAREVMFQRPPAKARMVSLGSLAFDFTLRIQSPVVSECKD